MKNIKLNAIELEHYRNTLKNSYGFTNDFLNKKYSYSEVFNSDFFIYVNHIVSSTVQKQSTEDRNNILNLEENEFKSILDKTTRITLDNNFKESIAITFEDDVNHLFKYYYLLTYLFHYKQYTFSDNNLSWRCTLHLTTLEKRVNYFKSNVLNEIKRNLIERLVLELDTSLNVMFFISELKENNGFNNETLDTTSIYALYLKWYLKNTENKDSFNKVNYLSRYYVLSNRMENKSFFNNFIKDVYLYINTGKGFNLSLNELVNATDYKSTEDKEKSIKLYGDVKDISFKYEGIYENSYDETDSVITVAITGLVMNLMTSSKGFSSIKTDIYFKLLLDFSDNKLTLNTKSMLEHFRQPRKRTLSTIRDEDFN